MIETYLAGSNIESGGKGINSVGDAVYNPNGNSFLSNDVSRAFTAGVTDLLGGRTQVNRYATKTGEQMDYANAALKTGQYGLSQLAQLGSGVNNYYNQLQPGMGQYTRGYINPMMTAVNQRLMHSTNRYSSANQLQRQAAMMNIGSELAKAVGTERQLQMQGGLAGQQNQLSALGQITGASNNALNQSFFDTKVGKEGGIGGIVGSVIGAII